MSRAAEILCERWTLLIMRELLCGSERFNDIRRGVPLISRTVLAERLASLQAAGVVEHAADGAYRPTASGRALLPIVVGLAQWGEAHIRDEIRADQLDVGLLMWDIRRNLRADAMPAGRHVIAIRFIDAPQGKCEWWLVAGADGVELCLTDPGHEPNLWLTTDVRTLTEVWLGQRSIRTSIQHGEITVVGDRALERRISRWLPGTVLSQIQHGRQAKIQS